MKPNKKGCDLKGCVLCRQSLKEWLPAIAANRKSLHFKKTELLFTEGTAMAGMYFVTRGLVKVHKRWGDEKELILRIARDGDIVGHRGLGSDVIYPVSATALEPTDVCYIDLDFFTTTLKVNQDLLYNLMMFFAAELKESEKRMRNLAHMPVKGRIANALIYLEQKFGCNDNGDINITMNRQDLASYTGTTYETLFRVMNELEDENAIKLNGKAVSIINRERLAAHTKDE
jgi:CRP/FNR family transcriptional regulator